VQHVQAIKDSSIGRRPQQIKRDTFYTTTPEGSFDPRNAKQLSIELDKVLYDESAEVRHAYSSRRSASSRLMDNAEQFQRRGHFLFFIGLPSNSAGIFKKVERTEVIHYQTNSCELVLRLLHVL